MHFCSKVVLSPGLSTHSNIWQLQPSEAPAASSAVSNGQARQPHYTSILLLVPESGTNLFPYLCMDIMPFSWVNMKPNFFDLFMNTTSKQKSAKQQNFVVLFYVYKVYTFAWCYCERKGLFQVCFCSYVHFLASPRGQCSVEGLSHV